MDLITHVKSFVTVVQCGSFSEAGRQLGVVPSVIARRISQLEEHMQTRLLERSTRKLALTDAGERFYARASTLTVEFSELVDGLRQGESQPQGLIRVMAPTSLTVVQLGPLFCRFMRDHPGIHLELALVDKSTNPAESGFDMAISGRMASYEGVVDMPLQPVQGVLCAAPQLLQQYRPEHPRDLERLPCLVFAAIGTNWTFTSNRGALSVEVTARLQADDNQTLLHAARMGLGFCVLPGYIARESLEDGSLVRALPQFQPQETWFKAYVPKRKLQQARLRLLIDYLQQHWPAVNS